MRLIVVEVKAQNSATKLVPKLLFWNAIIVETLFPATKSAVIVRETGVSRAITFPKRLWERGFADFVSDHV